MRRLQQNIPFLTILNGVVLGSALILYSFSPRKFIPIEVVIVVLAMQMNGLSAFEIPYFLLKANRKIKSAFFLFIAFLVVFALRQLWEDCIIFSRVDQGIIRSFDYFIKDVGLTFVLASIFWGRLSLPQIGGMASIVISVGIWAAANLVAEKLGFQSGAIANSFGESRYGFAETRWMPPLAESNGIFSIACFISAVTGILLLANSFQRQPFRWNLLLRLIVGCGVVTALVAAIRCQFRTEFILLPILFFWYAAKSIRKVKIIVLYAFVLCFFIAPILLAGKRGEHLLDMVQLDEIVKLSGSTTEDVLTLSGRTQIYDYGLERLSNPYVFFFGDGPSFRDASPSTADIRTTSVVQRGIGFHSSFLELLVANGSIMAFTVCFAWITCLFIVCRLNLANRFMSQILDVTLFNFLAWLSQSLTDAAMFYYFNTIVLSLIPLFGALRYLPSPSQPRPNYSIETSENSRLSG